MRAFLADLSKERSTWRWASPLWVPRPDVHGDVVVVRDVREFEASNVNDPDVRQAVLDLFHANEAFRDAFVSGDEQDLGEAAERIDAARERVFLAQTLMDRRIQ